MTITEILIPLISLLLLIVSFFSRTAYLEVKLELKTLKVELVKTNTENGRIKGEIRIIEVQMKNDHSLLREETKSELKAISVTLARMEITANKTETILERNNELFQKLLEKTQL
jgi:biopolymer transport protein ExbD